MTHNLREALQFYADKTNWETVSLDEARKRLGSEVLRNKIADLLLSSVNAPEQEIYRVVREIVTLSERASPPTRNSQQDNEGERG